jgi:hypothetical protein
MDRHVFSPLRQLFGNFFLSSCARDQALGQHPSTQGTDPVPRRHQVPGGLETHSWLHPDEPARNLEAYATSPRILSVRIRICRRYEACRDLNHRLAKVISIRRNGQVATVATAVANDLGRRPLGALGWVRTPIAQWRQHRVLPWCRRLDPCRGTMDGGTERITYGIPLVGGWRLGRVSDWSGR